MVQSLKLIFLIAYTITIFLINSVIWLGIIFLCNLFLMLLLKTNVKKMIYTMYKISLFIIITFVINLLLTNIQTASLVLAKLILSFTFVYSYRKLLPPMELGKAVETIFTPLRIFGINTSDISLIVNMSVTFVPILTEELEQINTSLKSRCIRSIWNC